MAGAPVVQFGTRCAGAETLLAALIRDRAASRLFTGDATLWGEAAQAEASIRLGWIDAADRATELVSEIIMLRQQLLIDGVDRIVLCGMGGSSLAPEVISARYGVDLTVLDSTHPDTVARVLREDPVRTAVVVSSKSGSTIDTMSHLAAFEERFAQSGIDTSSRIIVVTDPGSPLEHYANEHGFRVFAADPSVGGRFSALTAFGLVPAGLAGADIGSLIAEARDAAPMLARDTDTNAAARLAAAIMCGLPQRYVCALVEVGCRVGLGDWIEQLVAESTGKQGAGVLPLVLHDGSPELSGKLPSSATLIALITELNEDSAISDSADVTVDAPLGAQFLLWEAATALLCRLLDVNPFDQPDVESAKTAARAILDAPAQSTDHPREWAILVAPITTQIFNASAPAVGADRIQAHPGATRNTLSEALSQLRASLAENGYLSIQIYADRLEYAAEGEQLREQFARQWPAPITLGWGPRFLHSTGQLHKGGPRVGAYLQIFVESALDVSIPGAEVGFARLVAAQARGDRDVLIERGRPVLAISTGDLSTLMSNIQSALRIE